MFLEITSTKNSSTKRFKVRRRSSFIDKGTLWNEPTCMCYQNHYSSFFLSLHHAWSSPHSPLQQKAPFFSCFNVSCSILLSPLFSLYLSSHQQRFYRGISSRLQCCSSVIICRIQFFCSKNFGKIQNFLCKIIRELMS